MATDSETIIDVWRGVIGVFFVAAACAQQITPVDHLPGGAEAFDANQHHEPLPCTVTFAKPQLNLGFRYETTYSARAPLAAGEHRWRILFQVTPRRGPAVYFTDSLDLPGPSDPAFDAVAKGTFFTGEGDYDVKWSLWDDLGRVCRKNTRIEAHLTAHERNLKVEMPPGAVGDFAWQPASQGSAAPKTRRITVLMNAALPIARQRQPPDNEWPALLTILSSVLERMPEADVRLIVFNLDQQRELFRKDGFTAKDVAGIAHEGDVLARWAVDANVLQNPAGGWELIGKLENAEIHAAPPPDAVLFLGLPATSMEKMPEETPQSGQTKAPRFLYLRYGSPGLDPQPVAPLLRGGRVRDASASSARGDGMGGLIPPALRGPGYPRPDPVEQAVRRMGGRTIVISSADTLTKAISEVEKR